MSDTEISTKNTVEDEMMIHEKKNQQEYKDVMSKKKDRQIFSMLAIGSLLEYVDVSLYIHMAVIINKAFFPQSVSNIWFFANLAVCSTYIFKPVGGLILGLLGDFIGRRFTLYITTTATAAACLITAVLPTYEQIGIISAYILTLCRILQGITSTGEFRGAQLYLMENIPDVRKQCIYASVLGLVANSGKFLAVTLSGFAIFISQVHPEAWRLAFIIGSLVGMTGTYARKTLKESVEFADAKKRLVKDVKSKRVLEHPVISMPLDKKAVFYFIVMNICQAFTFALIPFMYCKDLMVNLGFSAFDIVKQSEILTAIMVIIAAILCIGICFYRPLIVNIVLHHLGLLIIMVGPILIFYFSSRISILVFQVLMVLCAYGMGMYPAEPIFYKQFQIFKRSIVVLFGVSLAQAIASLMWVGPVQLVIKYVGPFWMYIFLLPMAVIALFGKYYFKKLHAKDPTPFKVYVT